MVARVVEAIVQDVTILDSHQIEWKPERAHDVIVFHVEILGLVDLERLLGLALITVKSVQLGSADQDVVATGNVNYVAAAAVAPVGDNI